MLIDFFRLKEEILSGFDEIEGLLTDGVIFRENLREAIKNEKLKINNNEFNLVVVGQFKRGKSTFVNALLGDKILPTAVVPLTSIITTIRYGDNLKIDVFFNDGSSKEINPGELEEYATERGNPENIKNVREICIYYPSDYLKNGVILIDTPGVGSVYQHNTDVAYEFLPNVDAALFLVTVDPPISSNEFEFLKDVKGHAVKIFFLLNKVDYVSDEDLNEALEFTKKIIEKELGYEIDIYPISAKLALEGKMYGDRSKLEESGLPDFEMVLENFLMKEKGAMLLLSGAKKGLQLINEIAFNLELELKALQTPVEELLKKVEILQEKINKVHQEQKDMNYVLEGETKNLFDRLNEEFSKFKEGKARDLEKRLDKFFEENKGLGSQELSKKMDEYVINLVIEEVDLWREKQIEHFEKSYKVITQRLVEKSKEMVDALFKTASDLFDMEFRPVSAIEALDPGGYFYYKTERESGFFLPKPANLIRLLPGGMAKKIILNESKKHLEQQFDRQCGRVRYNLYEKLQNSFRTYKNNMDEYINTLIEGMKKAIEKGTELKAKGEKEILREKERLENTKKELKKIRLKFDGIVADLKDSSQRGGADVGKSIQG
jgi:small GTP-binding protein